MELVRTEKIGIAIGLYPAFEEVVLHEDAEYKIFISARRFGAKVRQLKREPHIEQYLEYAVKGPEDWAWLKERLDPGNEQRIPTDWHERVRRWKNYRLSDVRLSADLGTYYGLIRSLMGPENVSLMFYDHPDFIHKINEAVYRICEANLSKVYKEGIVPDMLFGWEDLAYKAGPLLSPTHFREFCLPYYKRMAKIYKQFQPDLITIVDSDGKLDEIIPLWIEGGVKAFCPIKIAAGNDLILLRKKYGRIGFMGGIDKHALAKGKKEIYEEVMKKVPQLIAEGGYIPMVDHFVPPEVSVEHYCYYVNLLKSIYGMN